MDWGRLRFFFSEVLRNFTRNAVMQLTAIATVTVTIAILGSFLFVRETLGAIGDTMLHQIEISVFLDSSLTPAGERALQARIAADPRVLAVTFISRAEGLRQMRERLRGQIDTSLLTNNPLPDSMRVKVVEPSRVHAVAATIAKLPGVASVNYAQDAVTRALRVGDVFARLGLVLVGVLVLVAAIIISNTIRLTVLARRREIAIMQLVGATNGFIRGPFVFEGLLAGLLGAAIALGLLVLAQQQLLPKLVIALPFIPIATAMPSPGLLAAELLGTGAAVGIVASWFSVGRYLRT
jgi:cell division transport system permease protein